MMVKDDIKLPNSGRVVIVDDTYDEVKPIMDFMGKNNSPYLYYDGKRETLPDKPMSGIRFVFLDIELAGFEGQSEKSKASALTSCLRSLISNENGPYAIIFWTKHSEIIDLVIENCEKVGIPPIIHVNLEKQDCKNEKHEFDFNIISKKISEKLATIGAFQLYTEWENIVNNSCTHFINKFSGFTPLDEKWQSTTLNIFYELFHAAAGRNKPTEKRKQFELAYSVLNRSFSDTLERKTTKKISIPDDLKFSRGSLDKSIIAKINSSLLISKIPLQESGLGNVNLIENSNDYLAVLQAAMLKKKYDSMKKCKLCRIIITPSCDIAQNKLLKHNDVPVHRVVYGILCPADAIYNKEDKGKDAFFQVGPIWIEDEAKVILSHFGTITFEVDMKPNIPACFALKRDLVFDLQSKAANHVNRLGNLQLEFKAES